MTGDGMSARDLARRAILESAILGELTQANRATREELAEAGMAPGDKLNVPGLGYVQITNPAGSLQVVDWTALTKWIEDNAPDQGLITKVEVSSAFVKHLISQDGEFTDPGTGECITVPGFGKVAGKPALRVVPSDEAAEVARGILGRQLSLEAGQ